MKNGLLESKTENGMDLFFVFNPGTAGRSRKTGLWRSLPSASWKSVAVPQTLTGTHSRSSTYLNGCIMVFLLPRTEHSRKLLQ